MIYTVTMNPSLDYVMVLKEARLGELNRSSREMHLSGGKGINVSIVLNNLGIRSTCLGFLAGYVGREIERELRQRGCHTDFIELESGCTRINVKVKEVCGRESELNGNGPEIDERGLKRLEEKVSALQDQDTLILSGNVPQGVAADVYGRLAAAAQGKRVTLVVDAEKSLLFPALPYRPFLIKPRDGAFFLSENGEELWINAPKGTVINTVGSGDSMVAGFISSRECGKSLRECACYAVAAGSAGAFSELLPERGRTEQLYREISENQLA